jgi:hypothetical protein
MNAHRLPPGTSWLLRQVSSYRAESLIGDLAEQYASGRGTAWYYRQVILAVATSHVRLVRLHGVRFLGAITLGAGGVPLCIALIEWLSDIFWHHEMLIFGSSLPENRLRTIDLVMFWVAWTPLTALLYGIIGRCVAHSYRPRPKLVVGSFVCVILASRLPWTLKLFLFDMDDSQYVSYPVQDLVATFLCVAGAWCGGLWQMSIDSASTPRAVAPRRTRDNTHTISNFDGEER